MLMFREEKSPEDEIKAWQFWHSRQHSVKQRILDAGMYIYIYTWNIITNKQFYYYMPYPLSWFFTNNFPALLKAHYSFFIYLHFTHAYTMCILIIPCRVGKHNISIVIRIVKICYAFTYTLYIYLYICLCDMRVSRSAYTLPHLLTAKLLIIFTIHLVNWWFVHPKSSVYMCRPRIY